MTKTPLFSVLPVPLVPVAGQNEAFPVGRIFCVGQNYAAHAAEMGSEVDRETPFYFTKTPSSAFCHSGETRPYALGTANYHFEMELVLAIGAPAFRASKENAMDAVFGYGAGLDMTRRDLQAQFKDKGRPWDLSKDFEDSAVLAEITPAAEFGALARQRIQLRQNGELRQDATIDDLVWSVPEIINHLSGFYHLMPGDLIFTGTPAGVGPVAEGDVLLGEIEGLAPVSLTIGQAE